MSLQIEHLIVEHKDAVYRQILRTCHGNREDAEDALAEAILSALKASDALHETASFKGWLTTIARRICIRVLRRRGLTEAFESSGFCVDDVVVHALLQDQLIERMQFRDAIQRILAELPPRYRSLYAKVDIDECDLLEVCQEMGITYEAGKSRIRRARLLVRKQIDEHLSEESIDHLEPVCIH